MKYIFESNSSCFTILFSYFLYEFTKLMISYQEIDDFTKLNYLSTLKDRRIVQIKQTFRKSMFFFNVNAKQTRNYANVINWAKWKANYHRNIKDLIAFRFSG